MTLSEQHFGDCVTVDSACNGGLTDIFVCREVRVASQSIPFVTMSSWTTDRDCREERIVQRQLQFHRNQVRAWSRSARGDRSRKCDKILGRDSQQRRDVVEHIAVRCHRSWANRGGDPACADCRREAGFSSPRWPVLGHRGPGVPESPGVLLPDDSVQR